MILITHKIVQRINTWFKGDIARFPEWFLGVWLISLIAYGIAAMTITLAGVATLNSLPPLLPDALVFMIGLLAIAFNWLPSIAVWRAIKRRQAKDPRVDIKDLELQHMTEKEWG